MESKVNIFKALALFQSKVPIIHKDTTGYGYTYADLAEITRIITPILKECNLGYTQPMNGDKLQTILFHESGESIESSMLIPSDDLKGMNKYQSLGSAITYLRRYMLSSILGIVTDKDIDGCVVPLNKTEEKSKKQFDITEIQEKLSKVTNTDELTKLFNTLSSADRTLVKDLFSQRKNEITNVQ